MEPEEDIAGQFHYIIQLACAAIVACFLAVMAFEHAQDEPVPPEITTPSTTPPVIYQP